MASYIKKIIQLNIKKESSKCSPIAKGLSSESVISKNKPANCSSFNKTLPAQAPNIS